jgi:hypothetical protein
MKRTSTVSQNVRIFVTAAALAVGAMGCGGGSDGSGAGGSGGSGAPCDATPIFVKANHTCTLAGACHDATGAAANFDMVTAGWQNSLVAKAPPGGSPSNTAALDSKCSATSTPPVQGQVYLKAGVQPAAGLFIEKLRGSGTSLPPCGAHMPNLGQALTDTEFACVQSWANGIVAAHQ